jgi:hypothetical protein
MGRSRHGTSRATTYAIALYDRDPKRLQPLADKEAALLINRDPLIRKGWCKWNRASRNRGGSLIVLDSERALRILAATTEEPDGDDEVRGLA